MVHSSKPSQSKLVGSGRFCRTLSSRCLGRVLEADSAAKFRVHGKGATDSKQIQSWQALNTYNFAVVSMLKFSLFALVEAMHGVCRFSVT